MIRSLDELLAHGEPVVAAWDYVDNTRTTLYLFAVGASGATSIAKRTVPSVDREAMETHLKAKGVRLGATFGSSVFVWSFDDAGYTIWSHKGIAASGTQDRLVDVREVVRFVDPGDRGHRGVLLVRSDGNRETFVEEYVDVDIDLTYSESDLILGSRWAKYLGLDLAEWLDVPLIDELQP